MKKLFALVILFTAFATQHVHAQKIVPYDTVKKQIIYTEVVQVPNTDKGKLFDRAIRTLDVIYNEASKKMDTKDRDGGNLMMKCTTRVMLMDPKTKMLVADKDFIKYKLSISFKDGKYKYDFYDFHIDKGYKYTLEKMMDENPAAWKANRTQEKLEYLDKDIKANIEKLKEGLKSDKVVTKEDW
ncbi:MAG: DUF4468 domain-containing protein [Sphingobacteriales bacterium]|nr:MAG: DUF4468 domain-containing protein [Sphingobacteriales bacterium]